MIRIESAVAEQRVSINVLDGGDEAELDLVELDDFMRRHGDGVLGLDTETTGLGIYQPDFQIRLFQVGTAQESYIIPVSLGGEMVDAVRKICERGSRFVFHNPGFDLQVLERTLGIEMKGMWPKVLDTKVLAHLVDPRGKDEGGTGHKLEELVKYYVDPVVAEEIKGSIARQCKKLKCTRETYFKKVPLFDEDYLLYSGWDPILAMQLYDKLVPQIPAVSAGLIRFEMDLEEMCSYVEREGFLLDVEYSEALADKLKDEENTAKGLALDMGIEKINSGDQVAEVLESYGVRIINRTPTGKPKVDDALLQEIRDAQRGPLSELASAIIEGKKASKWRTTWVEKFLKLRDADNRCHANINPLQARTSRMSITGIPAQTLPSSDWMIRRCFLADEGHVISSIDYKAQELRVLAALSGDRTMIEAFLRDEDLHLLTARAAFGEHITKDDKERKWGKGANFSRVYGGGAKTVAEQNHLDMGTAARIIAGFDKAYPEVKVLSGELQREAGKTGAIVTPSGRRLPVDPDRAYSALNYLIQSTSRDVTARAMLRLHKAGFTPNVRLPIHDEVVCSVPAEHAVWGANRIGEIMREQMGPVLIDTDPDVGGRSWGSLYLKAEDAEGCTDPYLLRGIAA